MTLLENLFSPGTIERLGWMLVHILWQATAVALLLAVFLRLLRNRSANVRYWIACSALALMVALPIVTIRLMKAPGPVAEAGPPSVIVTQPADASTADGEHAGKGEYWSERMMGERPADVPTFQYSMNPLSHPAPAPMREQIVSTLEPALPYVVLGWLVGVFGLSAWHLGGWAQLQRLRRRMVREVGRPLQQKLAELSIHLGVSRAVGLLESALIEVPTVVGWLRPVILLPASALTGLRPEQLEAILAHELAHVRRYDYLVNIAQTVVEILGFYHPAVWWISRRIRIERENCCDDWAVYVCGSSLQYAQALACMEEIRHSGTELALAATGGSLVTRIARLLGRPAVSDRRFAWLPGLVALLLVIGIIIPAALVLGTPQPPRAVESVAAAAASPDPAANEPNVAQTNAESGNGATSDNAVQILLDFKIVKVLDDGRLDHETALMMANALGVESPFAREFLRPNRKADMTLGEILKRYVVPQTLSEQAGDAVVALLQSRGYLEVSSRPRVLARDSQPATIRVIGERFLPPSDSSGKIQRIEYGTVVKAISQVLDAHRVNLEIMVEVSDLVPGPDFNQPTVVRTRAETNVIAQDNRYLVWAAVAPAPAPDGQETNRRSVYIMVKPRINLPPQGLASAPGPQESGRSPARRVLLEVRTVTTEQGALRSLSIPGSAPTAGIGMSPGIAGGVRTGYAADRTFTDAVLATLDRLQADRQATVSTQQVLAQEGRPSRLSAVTERWSAVARPATQPVAQPQAGPQRIDSGTIVSITPHVGDNNDIMVEIAIEVSQGLPKAPGSDLPLTTQRTVKSSVTVKDGGTAAIGGLSVNGTGGRPGQETAIFVTAHLLQDRNETPTQVPPSAGPDAHVAPPVSPTPEQTASMRRGYVNSDPMVNDLSKSIVALERDLITLQALVKEHPRLAQDRAALGDLKGKLLSRRRELEKEFDDGLTARTGQPLGDRTEDGRRTTITATFTNTDLRDILSQIAQRTGAKITPDATVKATRVTTELADASVDAALQRVSEGTPYVFKKTADGVYRVFQPLSNSYPGTDLCKVLQDLSEMTGVPIVAAPHVSGAVTATFEHLSLDEALELVLAGKPYVFTKMRGYYVVSDRASAPVPPPPSPPTTLPTYPNVTAAFTDMDLCDALAALSQHSRAKIVPDATVKPTRITVEFSDISVDAALRQVLKNTPYRFKKADDGAYLVFLPLSNVFPGVDLAQALRDVSVAACVPVVVAPEVSGTATVWFENLSLEAALELVLAGRPYVFQKMPHYYLVSDRSTSSRTNVSPTTAKTVVRESAQVTATFADVDLRAVLAEVSRQTGVPITPDATVKPTSVTAKLVNTSADAALRQVLKNTPYRFEKADDGAYLVFLPLTNAFPPVDLTLILQDLSMAAGVPIVAAPDVSGTATVWFENLSLEAALELVLAGRPYVFQKMPHYYLVTGRSTSSRTNVSPTTAKTVVRESAQVTATFADVDLRAVLAEVSKQTGVPIAPDATVKATPVTTELADASAEAALQQVLENTPYTFRSSDNGGYSVFRPQTFTFAGVDLVQAIQDLATSAGVPIIAHPDVSGTVSAAFENVTIEEALQLMLAGKPLVYKKMPSYYFVASPSIASQVSSDAVVTRHVRLGDTPVRRTTKTLPLMVVLDARVVSMERGNLLNLGVEWSWPTLQAGVFTSHGVTNTEGGTTSDWPYGVQIGYVPDHTFTNSLLMALGRLQENGQADILANRKVVAPDGHRTEMKVLEEQWSLMTVPSPADGGELSKPDGLVLRMTPFIGDNNDITLLMAVEINDIIPQVRASDPPRTTRRTMKNSVTIQDGGTVAVGGLTENRSKMTEKRAAGLSSIPLIGGLFKNKNSGKSSREVAVFVTAHLVPDTNQAPLKPAAFVETKTQAQKVVNTAEAEQTPAVDPNGSRAWSIMRQTNCPPLLLGLTQQLLKVLEPSRQDDAMWRETAGGGRLQLNVKVEQIESREIVVGLFADAKWSQEPVAVRLLPGEGTHTLTGLPAGRYQIGAMMGRAPSPAALGVQQTWPEMVEIKPGQTTQAELLVSRAFAFNASGRHNQTVSRDYTGDWSLLNENRLLQGRLTRPDGAPIPFGRVAVREYQAVPTGSIAAPELGTNEDGFYKFDGMKWPYRVSATWSDTLPDLLGYRYQYKGLNRVFEGPQKVNFQFDRFPAGTARIAGRVVDEHGAAVTAFYLRVSTLESSTPPRTGGSPDSDAGISTTFGYRVPFLAADGSFTLSGLPAGRVAVSVAAFDYRPYKFNRETEVVLEAGKTTEVPFEMIHNKLFYGRVLFEDGRPAVVQPAPWEGARTSISLRVDETLSLGRSLVGYTMHDVGETDDEGCFAVYLLDRELDSLRSGAGKLRIRLPGPQRDQWQSGGEFPFGKLAENKAQTNTVTIRRPPPMTTSAAGMTSADFALPIELRSVGSPEETRRARQLKDSAASDPLVLALKEHITEYRSAAPAIRTLMNRAFQVSLSAYVP